MQDSIGRTSVQGTWAGATSFQLNRDPVLWKQKCRDLLDETQERLQHVEVIVNAEGDAACGLGELATVIVQIRHVGLLVLEHYLRDSIAEASTDPDRGKGEAFHEWTRALERFVHTPG